MLYYLQQLLERGARDDRQARNPFFRSRPADCPAGQSGRAVSCIRLPGVELETRLLEAAKAVGIRVRRYILPAEISRADVELLIREINADFLLSAALLIEPLPERLDPASLAEMILPKKQIAVPGEPADPLTLLTRVADAAERSAK